VIEHRPIWGVGVGSQPLASHRLAAKKTLISKNASHTTPLTVAAELGLVGFLAYLAFLVTSALLLRDLTRRDRALGLGLAAVFTTLVVHSLFYSGFFEDPVTWGVVALAAAAMREGLAIRRA
jgi:O-antigen ligase